MNGKPVYEVRTVVGTYFREGKEYKRYLRIGSVVETNNGLMLKIDALPVLTGGWKGWAYLNKPRDRGEYEGLPEDEDY